MQSGGGCGCGTDVAGLTPIQAPGPMTGGRRRKTRRSKARRSNRKYKTRKH